MGCVVHSAPAPSGDVRQQVHVGRQPLYDRTGAVAGYEMLFRGWAGAAGATKSNSYATSQVIVNAFTEFGMHELVGDRMCFVNVTRDFLVGTLALPFDPQRAVLEVLETVDVDDEVLAGVARLAGQGYLIALDDFVWGGGHERLLDLASYVKIDMLDADPAYIRTVSDMCRAHPGVRLVAERLETDEHVALARSVGCELFQGYALGRPQVMSTTGLSPSRVRYVKLMGSLSGPDVDLAEVVSIVTADPALSFRLLRVCNSAASGLRQPVDSVHQAVVLLGTVRIRQWVSLMLLSDAAEADEAQLTAITTRARLCQILAGHVGAPGESAFTVGLLSGVGELLGREGADLVSQLPLAPAVIEALVNGTGELGRILQVARAYDTGDPHRAAASGIELANLTHAYLAATGWSTRTMDAVLG
jgi:c-di-GMP-related signal transduction protein